MKTMKRITNSIICVVAAIFLLNITACKKVSSYDYPPSVGTAYDILKNDNTYSTFFAAIVRSGTSDLFKGGDAYTIYAPTNTAITNEGYTTAQLNTMLVADLAVFVKSHIVAGATDVKSIGATAQQTSLAGTKITVQKIGNLLYANGGDITTPSLTVTNGFLNIITTVLINKDNLLAAVNGYGAANSAANLRMTFLAAAITRASTGSTNFTALLSGSTPYTLLAPSDAAFVDGGYANVAAVNAANAETLGAILKRHLIPGAKLTTAFDSVPVNDYNGNPVYFDRMLRAPSSTTTAATNFTYWSADGIYFGNAGASNIIAGNGVMHVVQRFLPVPVTTNTLARINSDATLTMFAALIQRASTADPNLNFASILADPLKSYTVFAVTDAGLIAAGYANVAAINAEDPGVLANILKFHMFPKRVNSINIAENGTVSTLLPSGTDYAAVTYTNVVSKTGFNIKGNGNASAFAVSPANVVTTNGVLNVIGGVLKP